MIIVSVSIYACMMFMSVCLYDVYVCIVIMPVCVYGRMIYLFV